MDEWIHHLSCYHQHYPYVVCEEASYVLCEILSIVLPKIKCFLYNQQRRRYIGNEMHELPIGATSNWGDIAESNMCRIDVSEKVTGQVKSNNVRYQLGRHQLGRLGRPN